MHPKAAEDLDMRPVALAHLTKLHSRFQGSDAMTSEDSRNAQHFRVDNGFLKADSVGLGIRRSKDMQDLLPNAVASWGCRVVGTDEGDGWLRVGSNSFLPFFVSGIPVLSPDAKAKPAMSASSSPRSPQSDGPASPSLQASQGASLRKSPPMTPLATQLVAPSQSPGMAVGLFGPWAGHGCGAQFSPFGAPSPLPSFDFQALRELVRLLRECQKKVRKGIRPSEELLRVEQLKRSLMEDLAVHPRSGAWHYLLQELMMTQDAIEGKYPAPPVPSLPPNAISMGSQAAQVAPWSTFAANERSLDLVAGRRPEMNFSDSGDRSPRPSDSSDADVTRDSLVGGILSEALRPNTSDAAAAGAILEAAARPAPVRQPPRPPRSTITASPWAPRHSPSASQSPAASSAGVEDRCAQLERHMARVRQARRR